MDIEVLREDSTGFELKLKGEDHSFLSLLTEFLDKDEKVDYAAYKIEHPLVGEPKLFIKLKGVKKDSSEDLPISKIKGVGPKTAEKFEAAGLKSASQILQGSPSKLVEKTGVAEKTVLKILEEVKKAVPADKYGYRAVFKNALSEISKTFKTVKKGV